MRFFFFLVFTIYGCNNYSKEKLIGMYVLSPSENTRDTLYIYPNNKYKQVVYYWSGDFYGVNENTWSISEDRIDFIDFHVNYDSDLNNWSIPNDSIIHKNALISSLLPINWLGRIMINYDREVYYKRIGNLPKPQNPI